MAKQVLHDFLDGRGEVPAHQHPNGGGWIEDNCEVSADSYVSANSTVTHNSRVYNSLVDNSRVYNSRVDNSRVYNSRVDNSRVYNSLVDNETINKTTDLLTIGLIGSRDDTATFTRSGNVHTGCFHGTQEEFIKAVAKTHGENAHAKVYLAALEFAKRYFELTKEAA